MMVRRIVDILASDGAYLGSAAFLGTYVAVRLIMAAPGGGFLPVLDSRPVLAASAVLALTAFLRLVRSRTRAGEQRLAPAQKARTVFDGGSVLLAAGIVVSVLTHAEGRVVLADGQQLSWQEIAGASGKTRAGRFASMRRFSLGAEAIRPVLFEGGRWLLNVTAALTVTPEPQGTPRTLSPGSIIPAYADGTWFRITGFGYAPYYRIVSPTGDVHDEAFVVMRLFPPGSEDSFRILAMPNTFYVRYFPEGTPQAGGTAGGRVQLRVARNLDLLLPSRMLSLGEPVVAGGVVVSIEQVRNWVEVTFIRDQGLPLAAAGVLAMMGALALTGQGTRGAAAVLFRDRREA